jgi:hypothetical protein
MMANAFVALIDTIRQGLWVCQKAWQALVAQVWQGAALA